MAYPRPIPVDPRRYASIERRRPSTLGELDRIAREHEERERPFDPYVPPERYARAHHFAVNGDGFQEWLAAVGTLLSADVYPVTDGGLYEAYRSGETPEQFLQRMKEDDQRADEEYRRAELFRRNGDVIEFPGRYAQDERARMQAEADAYEQWLAEVGEQVMLKSGVDPSHVHEAFLEGTEPSEFAAYIIDHI
jgi:hypothetical protein